MSISSCSGPIWTIAGVALFLQILVFSASSPTSTPPSRTRDIRVKTECSYSFDEESRMKFANATKKCTEEINSINGTFANSTDLPLKEVDIDDKCMTKCFYKELNLLAEDNKPLKDELTKSLKGNFTEPKKAKINSIWNDCIDDAERVSKDKNFPKDNCKMVALQNYCMQQKFKVEKVLRTCDE